MPLLYPAIDILEGRAVRLRQGHFDQQTTYFDDPVEAAANWLGSGARALHVVDLDGAKSGAPVNLDAVEGICAAAVDVPVQLGGGLRTAEAVTAAFEAGVGRVVIGTAAYRDPAFLDAILGVHGSLVAVAVDVRGGKVSAAGWTEEMDMTAVEVTERLAGQGVQTVIYTNVDRDGMEDGPDVEGLRALRGVFAGDLFYSGGIGTLDHLRTLAGEDVEGVIVGKALFEGNFSVKDGQKALA